MIFNYYIGDRYGRDNLPIDNCETCPIFTTTNYLRKEAVGNKENPKIVFITQFPTRNQKSVESAFTGDNGKMFKTELNKLGIDLENDCLVVSVISCPVDEGKKPKTKELKSCLSRLEVNLGNFKEQPLFVPLGAPGTKAIMKGKISELKGNLFEEDGVKLFPIFNAAYIGRNIHMKAMWVKSLKEMWEIATGKHEEIPQEEIDSMYDYTICKSMDDVEKLIRDLQDVTKLSIDIETTGLNFLEDEIIGIGFSWNTFQGVYVPFTTVFPEESQYINPEEHKFIVTKRSKGKSKGERILKVTEIELYKFWGKHQERIIDLIKEIVVRPQFKVTGANYKFDQKFMETHWDIKIRNFVLDVGLMDFLLDENQFHSIKEQADRRYKDKKGYSLGIKKYLSDTDEEEGRYYKVPLHILGHYGCSDTDVTYRLAGDLYKELKVKPKLLALYKDMYIDMHYNYTEAELYGGWVDLEHAQKVIDDFEEECSVIASELFTLAGKEFNINSGMQLGNVLFEDLKLPNRGMTDGGLQYKTDKETLNLLAPKNPILADVVKYKNRQKMISTYLWKLVTFTNVDNRARENRTYFNFNLHGAVTGRLSAKGKSTNGLAIQTIPRKKEIRMCFTAPPDYFLVEHDYSQVELRIMAWYSQDPVMLNAFKTGEDLHSKMAALIFNKKPIVVKQKEEEPEDFCFYYKTEDDKEYLDGDAFLAKHGFKPEDGITKLQRKIAKGVNFGGAYGGGAKTLAKAINEKLDPTDEKVNEALAQHCIDVFFNTYKGLAKWRKLVISQLHSRGRVVSPLGRVRRLPQIYTGDKKLIIDAENEAVNSLVQGLGGDLEKMSNNRIIKRCKEEGLDFHFLFSVHDARFDEIHKLAMKRSLEIIREEMEREVLPGLVTPTDLTIWERWGGKELKLEDILKAG